MENTFNYIKFQEFFKISRNYDSDNSNFQFIRIKKSPKKSTILRERLGDCTKISRIFQELRLKKAGERMGRQRMK